MPESFDPYLNWLGIRDPERPPNHYRLLGVATFENDPEVLAHAADRQMSHVRTFQAGRRQADSQRLLNELATAKVCLLNPAKKADYDAALRAKATAAPPMAVPPPMLVEGHQPPPAPPEPLPESPSDSSASFRPGKWVPPVPVATSGLPSPVAVRSSSNLVISSKLVTTAIVLLALLAVVLVGLIVALKNPTLAAKLGLGGAAEDSSPAADDGTRGGPASKTEAKTELAIEPEPKTKTDVEPKPEPKPDPVKPDGQKPPVWVDASKDGIRCGKVFVKIASATVAWPQLIQEVGKTRSSEACLLVTVSLENAGTTPVVYAGWGAGDAAQAVEVKDNLDKSYARKVFFGATVEGQLDNSPLAAGGVATDVLPFEPPAEGEQITFLRLPLPAAALGQQGTLYFEIPAAMLTREPAPKPEPKTVVDERQAVPDDEAAQKALERIRLLFADDFRGSSPAQRKALAAKLLGAAGTETNTVLRYALLCEACDQAIAAGDTAAFQQALETLGREFRVDPAVRAIEVLQGLLQPSIKRPRSNEAYKAAAVMSMELARRARTSEKYDAAKELADLAWKIASKYGSETKDYGPKKAAADLKKEIQQWQQRYDAFQAAEKTLAQRPDDPAANLTCGLYVCSVRNDWQNALPLLAKGKDANLRKLAENDLAEPADAARMVELADGWWEAGETGEAGKPREELQRRALLLRAKSWYEKALPNLSGLDREAVLRQLKIAAAIK